jgi:paired amphipathic helix protein Sin3a
MELQQRWQYYTSSYISVEPTEGVPRSKLSKVVLTRNLPSGETDSDDGSISRPLSYDEGLVVSICLRSSKMVWGAGSSESFICTKAPPSAEAKAQHDKKVEMVTKHRAYKLREKFVMNNSWMRNLAQEEVEKQKADYHKWAEEPVMAEDGFGGAAAASADVEMSG